MLHSASIDSLGRAKYFVDCPVPMDMRKILEKAKLPKAIDYNSENNTRNL